MKKLLILLSICLFLNVSCMENSKNNNALSFFTSQFSRAQEAVKKLWQSCDKKNIQKAAAIAGILTGTVIGLYVIKKSFFKKKLSQVNQLIIMPPQPIDQLMKAIEDSNLSVVQQLLLPQNVININAEADNGHTPLQWAAFHGNTEIAQLLFKADAKINAINFNATPLTRAIEGEKLEMVKFLIQNGAMVNDPQGSLAPAPPIYEAVKSKNEEIVEYLISVKADVNAQTKSSGYTSLHFAAQENLTAIAQLLINNGASVTVQLPKNIIDMLNSNNAGNTPAHIAVKYGSLEVFKKLVAKDNNVLNIHNESGKTPVRLIWDLDETDKTNFKKYIDATFNTTLEDPNKDLGPIQIQ